MTGLLEIVQWSMRATFHIEDSELYTSSLDDKHSVYR